MDLEGARHAQLIPLFVIKINYDISNYNYKIKMLCREKLGQGTYGIVYSAISPEHKRHYAIKRNLIESQTSFIGSLRELDILIKNAKHPYIISVPHISFGNPFMNKMMSPLIGQDRDNQIDDKMHFIFEKATCDLGQHLVLNTIRDYKNLKRYMVHILLAIEHLHGKNIVHRDIKPQNILLFLDQNDRDGSGMAKLADFGMSKHLTVQEKNTPNVVTCWYRAPEMIVGYDNYDTKSDVWSLGCTLYEMIGKNAFLQNANDNDTELLNRILGKLPTKISAETYNKMIVKSPRRVRLTSRSSPKKRYPFSHQLGLNEKHKKLFNDTPGRFDEFCDLLTHLLDFDPDCRWSVSEALNHNFFAEYQTLIREVRKQNPIRNGNNSLIKIVNCAERRWGVEIAINIYKSRDQHKIWYTNRILFQSLDLYDRYISVMYEHVNKDKDIILESEEQGSIHSRYESQLRFLVCIYIMIKYFSSIHFQVSFKRIVPPEFGTPEALLIAEQFEGGLIKNGLGYDIYRPTVYEVADEYGDILSEYDIYSLLHIYLYDSWFYGLTMKEFYCEFKRRSHGVITN